MPSEHTPFCLICADTVPRHRCARLSRVLIRRAVSRVARLVRLWRRRTAESRALRSLSDRELRDFGVNHYEAEHAARKPFWRP